MIQTSLTIGMVFNSTLNEFGGPRLNGEQPYFNAKTGHIAVPFRVREIHVRASVAYFKLDGVFVQPASIFQLWSDIAGSMSPVIWCEHDDELGNGIHYKFNEGSMLDIRGNYNFQLRDLSGALPAVNPDPAVTNQLDGAVNVLIDFIA